MLLGFVLREVLELSFSNHAAASRVANCGHSFTEIVFDFMDSEDWLLVFVMLPLIVQCSSKLSEELLGSGSNNCGMRAPEEELYRRTGSNAPKGLKKNFSSCKDGESRPNLLLTFLRSISYAGKCSFFHTFGTKRLSHAYGSIGNNIQEVISNSVPKFGLKPVRSVEKLVETNVSPKSTEVFSSCDSALVKSKLDINMNQGGILVT
ncbi:hypothetical protein GQ457_HM000550 [Hibiscus cannabinus]